MTGVTTASASEVRAWLSDGDEIALVDVRENGRHGDGHPFFAVSAPYSVFEHRLPELVPNPRVRLVLFDDGEGVATLAAARAVACGHTRVHVLDGGAPAWAEAGYTLFSGVNVPSKAFGELLELEHHTPNLDAEQIANLPTTHPNHIIVDSRPWDEYHRFNIPGGVCCPNGEVALRIGELAPDPDTTIVVNCAGRTRSILGAETLRQFGIPNPVYAMRNGTQGWLLAGLQREEGATRRYSDAPIDPARLETLRAMAKKRAERTGVRYIDIDEALAWLRDEERTTYVFDVRSEEENKADGVPGVTHVLGGQLVQGTDQYVGVRGARTLLVDDELVRAPMMASWLYGMGHEVGVLVGGVETLRGVELPARPVTSLPTLPSMSAPDVAAGLRDDHVSVIDLRSVYRYRDGHVQGARWAMRSTLGNLGLAPGSTAVVVADDEVVAALAGQRLGELGITDVRRLATDEAAWREAGLEVVSTPDEPADDVSVFQQFHVHQRNAPNSSEAAANAYLSWEIGLVDQLDDEERAVFRLDHDRLGD